jgi:hypothetical protein
LWEKWKSSVLPLLVARCVPSCGARTKDKLREETHMHRKGFVSMLMFWWCAGGAHLAAQDLAAVRAPELDRPSLPASTNKDTTVADAQAAPTVGKLAEIIDRIVKREPEEMAAFDLYSPILEIYIQEMKPDKQMGLVPKSDVYLLGQADFRGRIKVHSMTRNEKKGSLLWSFEPAGFLQMILWTEGDSIKPTTNSSISGGRFWAK